MLKPHKICASLFLLILCLTNAQAQGDIAKSATPDALTITASASNERVRFTAPATVVQIRLEVYASSGKKLFDNELRGGNVLDWHLQNGQAEPLLDDTYLCVVTVKNLSGKITQRIGSVRVEKSVASLQPAAASQMTAQQSDAIGPVEENATLTILNDGETQTATVIAHDGTDGQLIRGRGALSFRLGDFYSGKDTEQMRLTAEGNLGIGITNPQVRLDVDGVIRASQGIIFPDGTTQYSAASKTLGAKSTMPDQVSDQILGGKHKFHTETVTQNHIAKFTDGFGTLGDSGITETAGGLISIGTPGSPDSLLNIQGTIPSLLGHMSVIRTTGSNNGFGLLMDATGTGNNNLGLSVNGVRKASFAWDNSRNFLGFVNFNYSSADFSLRVNSDGSLTFHDGASSAERFRITAAGNVGIGTFIPAKKLVVGGGLGNSGVFNDGIFVNIPGGAAITARDSTTGVEVQVNAETSGIGTVGTFTNHPLNFRTNNIERMRITTSGFVLVDGNLGVGGNLSAHNLPGVEFDVPTIDSVLDQGTDTTLAGNATATIKTIVVDVPADGFLVLFGSVRANSCGDGSAGRLDLFDESGGIGTFATAWFDGAASNNTFGPPTTTQTIQGVLPVSAGSRTLSLKFKNDCSLDTHYLNNTGSFIAMFFPVRY
jgi:hypothetical protein